MTAIEKLRQLGVKRAKLEADLENVRADIATWARAASTEGARQVDIVKATGYTREMVRRMLLPTKGAADYLGRR